MFLGLDASAWTAIGSVGTAVVAFAAAIFAGWQVLEARRSREERSRPFVVVDVQPSGAWRNALNLVVENIGRTVAHDVTMTFDPPLATTQDDHYPLSESVLVKEGIPTMPPGRRIEAVFDLSHERKGIDLPMRYDVTVNLNNSKGKPEPPQRYTIDLSHMYGLMHIQEYGVHHAAKSLREIERTIKKWTGSQGRLDVSTRNQDRRALDEVVEEFLTGHPPMMAYKPPPDWAIAVARNALVRAVIEAIPPLHRWLRRRLGPEQD